MTRRAFKRAYSHVRLWVREHGAWPAERDLGDCDRIAAECLYIRHSSAMEIPLWAITPRPKRPRGRGL
jgi:hypothetical protein